MEDVQKIFRLFGWRFRLIPQEADLLLRAAQSATQEQWSAIIAETVYRRTAGLLCYQLRRAGYAPPPLLQREYRQLSLINESTESELRRLAPILREQEIEILLIKGAALQLSVYGNSGIRPMDDMDWVFRSDADRDKAVLALEDAGYAPSGEDPEEDFWECPPFLLEFHRNIWGDERVRARMEDMAKGAEEAVWRRSRRSRLGAPFFVPALEDHLLILCNHLMKHSFEPGTWFTDLEAILCSDERFDWDVVLERAGAWGKLRPLAYAFYSMGAMSPDGLPGLVSLLPPKVRCALNAVKPNFMDRLLLSMAAEGALLEGEKEEWEHAPVANFLWLSSQEGFWAKTRLLWEAAFPRGEVMRQIYPSYRSFLRWWFISRRAGDLLRLGVRLGTRLVQGWWLEKVR